MTYNDLGPNGRKIILCSTPEDAETSLIIPAWKSGDQRVYESVCLSCGAATEIIFKSHIVWDRPDGPVFFECPHCRERIDSKFRNQLVNAPGAGWRALKPEVRGHHSYRFNATISDLANADWPILREEFLRAREDPLMLREFVTQVTAVGWQSVPDVDAGAAASRRENFSIEAIPEEVRFLLAATDWHDDRIEGLICGWSPTACYCLSHFVLDGDVLTDDSIMWALKDILETKWTHPYGAGKIGAGKIQILGCLCDEGDGDHTVRVREFVKSMRRTGFRNIFSAKGNAGQRQLLKRSKTEKGLMLVGTNQGKDQVFAILKSGKSGNSSLRFSSSLPSEFFSQLAAEKKVVIKKGGMFVSRYERIGSQANEALDLIVYNFALRTRFNPPPWGLLEQRLRGVGDPQPLPETMDDAEEALTHQAPRPYINNQHYSTPDGRPPAPREFDPGDDPSKPRPPERPAAIGSWMSRPPPGQRRMTHV
jgi:phage terminase large subunit GpA-like protein